MDIMVGGRGNGKTYRLVIQLLINNGIFITQTAECAKYINEIILSEIIKDIKEKTNIKYDCKEIAFCIDGFTIKRKKNKIKSNFMEEIFPSCTHSLNSNFEVSTISGEWYNYNVNKHDSKEYAAEFECIWKTRK